MPRPETRQQLHDAIRQYESGFQAERLAVSDFLSLLSHRDAFQRSHLPGHITGSVWIVNAELTKSLLVLHAKLGRWLQPGGHADGDEDVLNVALREGREETGLHSISPRDGELFDIDIHPIPARKDFPEHLHFDVRFLAVADENEPLLISDESTDLKWFPLDDIQQLTANNPSVMRMVSKTVTLRTKQ